MLFIYYHNENLQRNYNIMRDNFKINLVFLELIEFLGCYLDMLQLSGLNQMEPEIGSACQLGLPSLGQICIWQAISPDIFWASVCWPKKPQNNSTCCISTVQVAKVKHFPRLYWKTACTDLHKNVLFHIHQFNKAFTRILLLAIEQSFLFFTYKASNAFTSQFQFNIQKILIFSNVLGGWLYENLLSLIDGQICKPRGDRQITTILNLFSF